MNDEDIIKHLEIFLDKSFLFFRTDIILQIEEFVSVYIDFLKKDLDKNKMEQAIKNLENHVEKINPENIDFYFNEIGVIDQRLGEKAISYNWYRYNNYKYLARLLIRSYTDNHYPFLKQAVEFIPEFYRFKKSLEGLEEEVTIDSYGFVGNFQQYKKALSDLLYNILCGGSMSEYSIDKNGRKAELLYMGLGSFELYFKNYFAKKYKNYLSGKSETICYKPYKPK